MLYEAIYCANPRCRSARVLDRPRHVLSLERPVQRGAKVKCEVCNQETIVTVGPAGEIRAECRPKAS